MSEPGDGANAARPAATVRIEPLRRFVGIDLAELWRFRELAWFLALRDLKVRYRQAAFGVAWAVLQPFLTMVVFSALFGLLMGGRKPTVEGVPYAVSTYCALVPWLLFASSLTSSGNSLVMNQALITKIYFPRLLLPIAPIIAALVDFAAAFAVLLLMLLWYGIAPGPALLALPLFVALAVLSALSVSVGLAALNAIYRDVRHALPFLVQIWFFVTPCVYTTQSLLDGQPDWVWSLYALNPMVSVVEGFRWALLGAPAPAAGALLLSALAVVLLLCGGTLFFRRMERTLADVI